MSAPFPPFPDSPEEEARVRAALRTQGVHALSIQYTTAGAPLPILPEGHPLSPWGPRLVPEYRIDGVVVSAEVFQWARRIVF
jgi:hypothetical protein